LLHLKIRIFHELEILWSQSASGVADVSVQLRVEIFRSRTFRLESEDAKRLAGLRFPGIGVLGNTSGFDFLSVVKIKGENVSERWINLLENFDTRVVVVVVVVVVNFADFFFVVIVVINFFVVVVADVVIDSL
jgi:hypothetical protein